MQKNFCKKIFFSPTTLFSCCYLTCGRSPDVSKKRTTFFRQTVQKLFNFSWQFFFGCTLYMATKVRNACNFGTICQNLSCNSLNERSWQARYVGTQNVDLSTNMWTMVQEDILDFVRKYVSGCYWSVNLWACAKWDQSTVMWAEVRKKFFRPTIALWNPTHLGVAARRSTILAQPLIDISTRDQVHSAGLSWRHLVA